MGFEIGSIFGDYEVIGHLGRGAMGSVYKVRNTISDRIEALKVLLPYASAMQELSDRFLREIKVVATLEHPNIAQLRTALRVDDQLLMVMEWVQGASLEEKMKDPGVGIGEGVDYTCQVLSALAYAHARGVVHRDIKPANILMTTAGVAKVTDFGIASRQGDPKLTGTGVTLGSACYMSPEQVQSSQLDGRSDIYSVGVTLYEMVTGRRPIDGDSLFTVMQGHMVQIPRPPIEVSPKVPLALSQIIQRSLEKDPKVRFQTADEFRNALLSLGSSTRPPLENAPTAAFITPAATPPPALAAPMTDGHASASRSRAAWTPGVLEKVSKELAVYIGPLAKVIVGRAAKKAQNINELYQMIAPEIPSDTDRRKFMGNRAL